MWLTAQNRGNRHYHKHKFTLFLAKKIAINSYANPIPKKVQSQQNQNLRSWMTMSNIVKIAELHEK